jgi:hypothetical protein
MSFFMHKMAFFMHKISHGNIPVAMGRIRSNEIKF